MMRGGGETRHLAWARELRGLGIDVELVAGVPLVRAPRCPLEPADAVSIRTVYLRDLVYRLQGRHGFGRFSSWLLHQDDEQFVRAAWRHLADESIRPDVVHAHALHQAAVRRQFDVPVVINLPGVPHDRYRESLRSADALVSDGWGAAHLPAHLALPVEDVPKGVDTARFTPDGSSVREMLGYGTDPVILTVARLVPIKNVGLVLDAFVRISQRLPRVRLVVAGDGPERGKLERYAETRGCASRVHFAGRVEHEDLPAWYRSADVFALTSRFDNSPNVVLEAMAAGVPVIATDVGGVSRYMKNDRNGALVPANDADAVAHALEAILTNPARRDAIGRQNRLDALSGFSWRASAERLLSVYERVIDARRGRRSGFRAERSAACSHDHQRAEKGAGTGIPA
jgi:glycosyltransferase involved in cell wall biosynthesis